MVFLNYKSILSWSNPPSVSEILKYGSKPKTPFFHRIQRSIFVTQTLYIPICNVWVRAEGVSFGGLFLTFSDNGYLYIFN